MRELNYPARYVSGYLKMNDKEDQEATHAWTEVYVNNLGWVGIDVSNNIIVDENYIVLAPGVDYKDAKPLLGILFESENNSIITAIKVQQQSLRVKI
jgi:transglutaminase-like putative cysteine protease